MRLYQYAVLLALSAFMLSSCSTNMPATCDVAEASDPSNLVSECYSQKSDFVPPLWDLGVTLNNLPVSTAFRSSFVVSSIEDLNAKRMSIESAFPDLNLSSLYQINNIVKKLNAEGKKDQATKFLKEFTTRNSPDVLKQFLEINSQTVWLKLNLDPNANIDDHIARTFLILTLSGMNNTPEGRIILADMYYQQSLNKQAANKLKDANGYLSIVDDIDSDGEQRILSFMYRAINNFFLGRPLVSVSILMSAPEYTDQKNDYYLYNKLNLYIAIAQTNWLEARAYLQKFENSVIDENLKQTWAFQIIHAINSEDFTGLLAKLDEMSDSKNPNSKAENLCEAYYYVGVELYLRGQKNLARLMFVLSRGQGVTYFIEHTSSELALLNLFNDKQ